MAARRTAERERRKAFWQLIESCRVASKEWQCCGLRFTQRSTVSRHCGEAGHPLPDIAPLLPSVIPVAPVASIEPEIMTASGSLSHTVSKRAKIALPPKLQCAATLLPDGGLAKSKVAVSASKIEENIAHTDDGVIILFYKYVAVSDPAAVCGWQRRLCERLGLRGKVRIAHEGINGTLSGTEAATGEYIRCFLDSGDDVSKAMTANDFKVLKQPVFTRSRNDGRQGTALTRTIEEVTNPSLLTCDVVVVYCCTSIPIASEE